MGSPECRIPPRCTPDPAQTHLTNAHRRRWWGAACPVRTHGRERGLQSPRSQMLHDRTPCLSTPTSHGGSHSRVRWHDDDDRSRSNRQLLPGSRTTARTLLLLLNGRGQRGCSSLPSSAVVTAHPQGGCHLREHRQTVYRICSAPHGTPATPTYAHCCACSRAGRALTHACLVPPRAPCSGLACTAWVYM